MEGNFIILFKGNINKMLEFVITGFDAFVFCMSKLYSSNLIVSQHHREI